MMTAEQGQENEAENKPAENGAGGETDAEA